MKENHPSKTSDDEHRSFLLDQARTEITEPSSSKTRTCKASFPAHVLENVLENVLQFLTSRRDRNAASLVCRSWNRIEARTRTELYIDNCYAISPDRATARFPRIRSVTIKGKRWFFDYSELLPVDWDSPFCIWASPLAQAYPWLEKIYLKYMGVTDCDLTLLANSFSGLRELIFKCCYGFGTPGLAAIASKCSLLRVLEFRRTMVKDKEVDWISCFPQSQIHMESLDFEYVWSPVNFEALEGLVARSPNLKKIGLNNYVSISQMYRLMLLAPQLTHLGTGPFCAAEGLAVGGDDSYLEPDYASAFAACKSLTCLYGFHKFSADYLSAIHPVCANLTSLDLSKAVFNANQVKFVICHCHKLQIFWVRDSIRDEGLQAVAATCKDLRELRVYADTDEVDEESEVLVSEVGFEAISQGCRKLKTVLFFCLRMTNAAMVTMSKNCPDLVMFCLRILGRCKPDPVTQKPMDEGFGAIVMNCKKLTRLNLSGLLTDRAFEYIGRYGKSIRTLSVEFAGDSGLGLKYVLEGCPNLMKLNIGNSPFGDEALRSYLLHYYKMKFLWMKYCRLTLQGCQEVARALPHLVLEVINKDEDVGDDVHVLYMFRAVDEPWSDVEDVEGNSPHDHSNLYQYYIFK